MMKMKGWKLVGMSAVGAEGDHAEARIQRS